MALDSWQIDIAGDPLDVKNAIDAMVSSPDPVIQIPNRVSNRATAEINSLGAMPANTGVHVYATRSVSPGAVTETLVVRLVKLFV